MFHVDVASDVSPDEIQQSFQLSRDTYQELIADTEVIESGFDAGESGFDAGESGFNAGESGFNADESGFDASESGFDAGESGFNASESCFDAGESGFDAGESGFDASESGFDASESGFDASEMTFDQPMAELPIESSVLANKRMQRIDIKKRGPGARVVQRPWEAGRAGKPPGGKGMLKHAYAARLGKWKEAFMKMMEGKRKNSFAIRLRVARQSRSVDLNAVCGYDQGVVEEQVRAAEEHYNFDARSWGFTSVCDGKEEADFTWSDEIDQAQGTRKVDPYVKQLKKTLKNITGSNDNRPLETLIGVAMCSIGLQVDIGSIRDAKTPCKKQGASCDVSDKYKEHLAKLVRPTLEAKERGMA